MLYAFIVFLLLIIGGLSFLLVRASRRLLQFDEVFEHIVPVLEDYGGELKRTLSAGLLEDHPEVVAFHKLNVFALSKIDAITEMARAMRPKKQPKLPPNYLPPLVE